MNATIYIWADETNPNICKIGGTNRTPKIRCAEYNKEHGFRFWPFHSFDEPNGWSKEYYIHRRLEPHRFNKTGRGCYEVYAIDPCDAVIRVADLIAEYNRQLSFEFV
jgi:hypothetical protein